MRLTLTEHFGDDKIVGMGGVFVMKIGKAKQHVMNQVTETI